MVGFLLELGLSGYALQPPSLIMVELMVQMHCETCAQVLQKRIRKIQGVEMVEADVASDKVTVKGVIDPQNLVVYVNKRTSRHVTIIVKEEEKKDEGKKDEGKKDGDEKVKKKDGEVEEEVKGEDDGAKLDVKKSEYWPPPCSTWTTHTFTHLRSFAMTTPMLAP